MFQPRLLSLTALILAVSITSAQEALPTGAKVTKLEATPSVIAPKHLFDYRQVFVTATLSTGERMDVTRLVKVETPKIIKVSPTGLVRPLTDGEGQLRF